MSKHCGIKDFGSLVAIAVSTVLLVSSSLRAETVIAIRGGTVLTMTGETLSEGIVLIRGEKIAEVGKDVQVPKAPPSSMRPESMSCRV